ncbi:MAG: class I SAM-dependent methyltransferase [Deltaproteobacteria bacterium]|nr:class I SAM-dependent methyltransferase [Deltaproteobacteria bacterium]
MKKYLRSIIKKFVAIGLTEYIENQRLVAKEVEENKAIIAEIARQNEDSHKVITEYAEKMNADSYKSITEYAEKMNADCYKAIAEIYEKVMKELPSTTWSLISEHTHLSGKFFPYKSQASFYHVPKQHNLMENLGDPVALPIPPKHLWEGYAETEDGYLDTGRVHVTRMVEILSQDNFQIQSDFRVMELGCAAARMLRWLADKAVSGEFWGVDICAEHIIWCQQNLSPPFHFFTTTTEPHLPFPDAYFDFVYAGSVFSHISELADFWFLELRRVLKNGGRLYVTIHDRNTIDRLFETNPTFFLSEELSKVDKETKILSTEFDMFAFAMFSNDEKRNPKGAMVFYDIDYLKRKFQDIFTIKSITQEAYGLQTALLFEKK